ncbi:LppC family lipoprotein [Serratia symbiotica str. 'Cinara cedri']|nr:LppC family lipoprotein [Serratia symbiotica str. 'Cinara cedri']
MLFSTLVATKAGTPKLVLLTTACLVLVGCSGLVLQTSPVNIQDRVLSSANDYLLKLQKCDNNSKAHWQLLAIRALLHEGRLLEASGYLGQLSKNLSSVQLVERQMLIAELDILNKKNIRARNVLDQLDSSLLSIDQKIRYYHAQITVNEGCYFLPLLRIYIAQERLLNGQVHQDNLDETWQILLKCTPQQINSAFINANENVLQGWMDLLRSYQDNRLALDPLQAAIKDWKTRYPEHPAAKTLPTQLKRVFSLAQSSITNIALLLPLSGQAKVFSAAILQGFEAAKNNIAVPPIALEALSAINSNQPFVIPAAPNSGEAVSNLLSSLDHPVTSSVLISPWQVFNNHQVKVYDTTDQSLVVVLNKVQQDGITLVVGPLLKEAVDQLSDINTSLNILALNHPKTTNDHPNICYFSLSPEDEARDAANHIWGQQHRYPLLLVPRTSFGNRIAAVFNQEWQKLGGQTVLQQSIGSMDELRQAANSGGLHLTGTPITSASTLPSMTTKNTPAVSFSNEIKKSDYMIDAIYIIATQAELTLIKPMIDMVIDSRSKQAIYASSRSYQAGSGIDFRLEMEGLQFSDIPLLAGFNSSLLQEAMSFFHNDYSLLRLYAMGVDAWILVNYFDALRYAPLLQISGVTGILTATPSCVINRKLTWLRYHNGMVVPIS